MLPLLRKIRRIVRPDTTDRIVVKRFKIKGLAARQVRKRVFRAIWKPGDDSRPPQNPK